MPIVHPACEFVRNLHSFVLSFTPALYGQQCTPLNAPHVHFIRLRIICSSSTHLYVASRRTILGVKATPHAPFTAAACFEKRSDIQHDTFSRQWYTFTVEIGGKMVSSCIEWGNDRRWKIRQFAVTDAWTHEKKILWQKNNQRKSFSFLVLFHTFFLLLSFSFFLSFFFFFIQTDSLTLIRLKTDISCTRTKLSK